MQNTLQKQMVIDEADEPDALTQLRTAKYIADLVGEMEELAARANISPLTEYLRVARQEAKRISATP